MSFTFKWKHKDGSIVELSERGWRAQDPKRSAWLRKMSAHCGSSSVLTRAMKVWLQKNCKPVDFINCLFRLAFLKSEAAKLTAPQRLPADLMTAFRLRQTRGTRPVVKVMEKRWQQNVVLMRHAMNFFVHAASRSPRASIPGESFVLWRNRWMKTINSLWHRTVAGDAFRTSE
jgi:hypothetical protein